MSLTQQQEEIVTHTRGNLVVLAGPGSGKTMTITEKISYLLDGDAIPEPYGLLAVTFTNAAANEMRSRLRTRSFRAWDRAWIGTFHGFGKYLLSCYGSDVGIREDFGILDTSARATLLDEIVSSLSLPQKASNLGNLIDNLKRQAVYPGRGDDRLPPEYQKAYGEYQRRLDEMNVLDFNDLVPMSLRLLRESTLARRLFTNFFRYVLVDEFQDTDSQQFRLIWGLANTAQGSTIVADDDQSIYGWRGANRENVYSIQEKLGAERIVLEANFRSDAVIVEAAKLNRTA